jgi:N-acylneuraminate cytidylyltransferase
MLDPRFTIDIDTLLDWERAEWMLARLDLPMVRPARPRRPLPAEVRLLALDFDGVLTDNRVWVDGDGSEWVACNRGDGLGLSLAKKAGIEVLVISREADPVVAARCGKLGIDCYQGVLDKEAVLKQLVAERGLAWSGVVFVGNDVTDLACMRLAGCGVAVADAHPDVLAEADVTLRLRGGHGAVREICDQILNGTRRE